jgi:hypothetical protein
VVQVEVKSLQCHIFNNGGSTIEALSIARCLMKIQSKQKVEDDMTTISSSRRQRERLDVISFHVVDMMQLG